MANCVVLIVQEDERRLGEQAVFPETVDVNIRQPDPFPHLAPSSKEQPLTDEMSEPRASLPSGDS